MPAIGRPDRDLFHYIAQHHMQFAQFDAGADLARVEPQILDHRSQGAAILAGVLEGLMVDEIVVSERDILDGIAMDPALAGGAPPE